MIVTKKQLQTLLKCVDKTGVREYLARPALCGENLIASNGHIFMSINLSDRPYGFSDFKRGVMFNSNENVRWHCVELKLNPSASEYNLIVFENELYIDNCLCDHGYSGNIQNYKQIFSHDSLASNYININFNYLKTVFEIIGDKKTGAIPTPLVSEKMKNVIYFNERFFFVVGLLNNY